jgi:hypothetical protein
MHMATETAEITIPMFSFWEMALITLFDIYPKSAEEVWVKPPVGPEGDLSVFIKMYTPWQIFCQFLGDEA